MSFYLYPIIASHFISSKLAAELLIKYSLALISINIIAVFVEQIYIKFQNFDFDYYFVRLILILTPLMAFAVSLSFHQLGNYWVLMPYSTAEILFRFHVNKLVILEKISENIKINIQKIIVEVSLVLLSLFFISEKYIVPFVFIILSFSRSFAIFQYFILPRSTSINQMKTKIWFLYGIPFAFLSFFVQLPTNYVQSGFDLTNSYQADLIIFNRYGFLIGTTLCGIILVEAAPRMLRVYKNTKDITFLTSNLQNYLVFILCGVLVFFTGKTLGITNRDSILLSLGSISFCLYNFAQKTIEIGGKSIIILGIIILSSAFSIILFIFVKIDVIAFSSVFVINYFLVSTSALKMESSPHTNFHFWLSTILIVPYTIYIFS